jgi:rhodanese-related sulfurtransferase
MHQRVKALRTFVGLALVCLGNPAIWTESAYSSPQEISVRGTYQKEITAKQAASKKDAGVYILDVRELREFVQGHIPGAIMIPLRQLKDRMNEIPKDKEIVVVCLSGARSRVGIEILREEGYEKSSSLAGGMNAWKTAGYPIATGP